jgi:hypothetical protein
MTDKKILQNPVKKDYPQSKLSDAAAKKVAEVLHIMLNDKKR